MKWLSLLLLLLTLATENSIAQNENDLKFIFPKSFEEIDYTEVEDGYFYNPPLGEQIAKGMEVVRNEYTYKPEPTPLYPNPGVEVEKPTIYYSVKKLYNHYKKQVRKGHIDMETAQERMSEIIKISVNIRYEETSDFENALKASKDPEDLDSVFALVEYEK